MAGRETEYECEMCECCPATARTRDGAHLCAECLADVTAYWMQFPPSYWRNFEVER